MTGSAPPTGLGVPEEKALYVAFPAKGEGILYGTRLLRLGAVASDGGLLVRHSALDGSSACSAAFAPDGSYWLTAGGDEAEVRDPRTGKVRYQVRSVGGRVLSASISESGSLFVLVTERGAEVRKATDGSLTGAVVSDDTRAAATGDGSVLVTCNANNEVAKWDVKAGKRLGSIDLGVADGRFKGVPGLVLSPDGKTAFAALWDGRVCAVDVATMKSRDVVDMVSSTTAIACSGDGRFLAVGTIYPDLSIVDLTTGKEIVRRFEMATEPASIAFSPDAKTLAVGSMNGRCGLFSVADKRLVWTTEPMTK